MGTKIGKAFSGRGKKEFVPWGRGGAPVERRSQTRGTAKNTEYSTFVRAS